MFKIKLRFEEMFKTGIEALDWRRAHGLSDDSAVKFIKTDSPLIIEVDEGFARLHFNPSDRLMGTTIDPNCLAAGEIVVNPDGEFTDSYKLNVTPERAKELFLANKHKALGWH